MYFYKRITLQYIYPIQTHLTNTNSILRTLEDDTEGNDGISTIKILI